jgi:hypothetical protein
VNLALGGFAERDDAGVKAVNQSAESQEVEFAGLRDLKTVTHRLFLAEKWKSF